MARVIPNMAVVKGKTRRLDVRKQGPQNYAARVTAVSRAAFQHGCKYFAIKCNGRWRVYTGAWQSARLVKSGLTEDAAAMWLIHKEMHDG